MGEGRRLLGSDDLHSIELDADDAHIAAAVRR
jgi:hypothetical protein